MPWGEACTILSIYVMCVVLGYMHIYDMTAAVHVFVLLSYYMFDFVVSNAESWISVDSE